MRRAELIEYAMRPEISSAKAILELGIEPPEVLRRAQRLLDLLGNGVLDPEPVLLDVVLRKREFSHTAGNLEVTVLDEDGDLLGIRVEERYMLPSGVESVFQEDYPLYVDAPRGAPLGQERFPVRFRRENRVKDKQRWQAYVHHVSTAQKTMKVRPFVWLAVPRPGEIDVFVSVYDQAGNESEAVRLRWDPPKFGPALDSHDLKEYREHGTEVMLWPSYVASARPDNAALLYYRATACLAKPDPCTAMIMNLMGSGGEPDDRVRAHLGGCLKGIQLAQFASQITECDFGLVHDLVEEHAMDTLASLRRLSSTLAVHARTLAADGHYRIALENCLVIRRFAQHIGDDVYLLYLVSRSVDAKAIACILDFLGDMPADVETFTWLHQQLAMVQGAPARPAVALEKWRGHRVYDVFIDSAVEIMEGDLPYKEKQARLKELERAPGGRTRLHELAIALADATPEVQAYHRFMVRDQAFLDCAKVAVDILLLVAQAGRLPDTLPEGLPKDPYTGESFQYERTETGFVLRLDPENLGRMNKREFPFTVARP